MSLKKHTTFFTASSDMLLNTSSCLAHASCPVLASFLGLLLAFDIPEPIFDEGNWRRRKSFPDLLMAKTLTPRIFLSGCPAVPPKNLDVAWDIFIIEVKYKTSQD